VPECSPSIQVYAESEGMDANHDAPYVGAFVQSRPGLRRVRVEAPHLIRHGCEHTSRRTTHRPLRAPSARQIR
jgi:hypothetical protein